MRPILRVEVMPLAEYEEVRGEYRARVIAEKRARRVALGEHLSVLFENRETVMLQVLEMLRTEKITTESGINHELATYNELVPGQDQLSLTMFVEIADKALRDRMLVELAGLEDSIALEVNGVLFRARGKREGAVEGRTTAVHYLKIAVAPDAAQEIRDKRATVALVVQHGAYDARTELGIETLVKLADDLA